MAEPRALMLEQPALALESARVAGQTSVGADDAVTRDDDRDRVAAHRRADGADGLRGAYATGQLGIADGLAEPDGAERLPDPKLELGAAEGQRQVELPPASREELGELRGGRAERRVVAPPGCVGRG